MEKRGQRRYQAEFGPIDYYRYYRRTTKNKNKRHKFVLLDESKRVNYNLYSDILNDYFLEVIKEIFDNQRYKLPCNFGFVQVRKNKARTISTKNKIGLPIDWKESRRLHKRIYLTNEHREGFVYKIMWKRGRHPGITWYCFKPCRIFKRRLAFELKSNKSLDFYERAYLIDNYVTKVKPTHKYLE